MSQPLQISVDEVQLLKQQTSVVRGLPLFIATVTHSCYVVPSDQYDGTHESFASVDQPLSLALRAASSRMPSALPRNSSLAK